MSDEITIDIEMLGFFLEEGLELLGTWEKECIELEKSPSQDTLNSLFRIAHNLKGSSRSTGLTTFGECMHKIEDLIGHVKKDPTLCTTKVVGFLLQCQSFLVAWLEELKNDPNHTPDWSEIKSFLTNYFNEQVAKGPVPAPEEIASPAEALVAHVATSEVAPTTDIKATPAITKLSVAPKEKAKVEESIRVPASKLDRLMQLVGELSIHQSVIWHGKTTNTLNSKHCDNSISLATKIIKDLQDHSMGLRMLSVEGLFQRLERTARDVARAQSKVVDIVLEGVDVELDKTVIEKVTDPLVHMIRNSIDHGIESNEDREKNGKNRIGRVVLCAHQEAGSVLITIQDDGKGLNSEKLREKAIDKGLISPNQEMRPEEIYQLIFLPGFSTAEKVTDISGRGVGMDVVRQAVDSLGGSVRITSEVGKGTTFYISLPTSLSLMEGLIVLLDETKYIVPIQNIEEIINLKECTIETSTNLQKLISLRGSSIPVEELRQYIPRTGKDKKEPSSHKLALIVKCGNGRVAFSVDTVVGQQQVFVRPLDSTLASVPGFCGGTILSDGEPALIINLPKISNSFNERVRASRTAA